MPRPQDRVEFSLEGPQLAGVVSGALVTLAVVFALGVGFGRQLSTAPAAAAPPTDLARLDAAAPAATQDTGFTFHDSLAKATPPPVVAPKPAAAPIEAPKEAPKPVVAETKSAEPSASPAPAPIAAEPVAPAPAPTKDDAVPKADPPKPIVAAAPAAPAPVAEKKAALPVEPPKAVAAPVKETGGWCVQFGASPNRADADKLASTLHGFGYTSYVVVADIPGKGRYYRVRVGHFASKDEADKLRSDASGAHKQLQPGVVMPAR